MTKMAVKQRTKIAKRPYFDFLSALLVSFSEHINNVLEAVIFGRQ